MLIAIDIGNTNIKAGSFLNGELQELILIKDSIPNSLLPAENDFAVSSVVPAKTKLISEKISEAAGKKPFIISGDIKYNLKIAYDTPETLGPDRVASAEGAFLLFRKSIEFVAYNNKTYIITIDFGTATTINIVKYPGIFSGGIIAPGLNLMFNSLRSGTAQLPEVSVEDYIDLIGSSTKSSMASGVINSVTGLIDKVLNNITNENDGEAVIYITGGNAKKIIPFLKFDFTYEEGLVLYGIKALWDLNQ
jgi:type III pantothenate kinase